MTPLHFDHIRKNVLIKLQELDKRLVYHDISHTLDVMDQALRIASEDSSLSERDIYLLRLAALYHDTGFLEVYNGHEEISCKYFTEAADGFGLSPEEVNKVRDIIMATKITNQPHTKLECIIRDADLDYLGREDFSEISLTLKQELFDFGFIDNEEDWNRMQLGFLKNHQYYTPTSIALRGPVKQQNLQALMETHG